MRHGLQRLAELVLLVTVILIITLLAQRAASKAAVTLDDAGKTSLPDISRILPHTTTVSGDLLTLDNARLIFHPERLPSGSWEVTIQEETMNGLITILQEDVTGNAEELKPHVVRNAVLETPAASILVTLTSLDRKDGPVTSLSYLYVYTNPDWLRASWLRGQEKTLLDFASLIQQLPSKTLPSFLERCRLRGTTLSLASLLLSDTAVQDAYCDIQGSTAHDTAAVRAPCATARTREACQACLVRKVRAGNRILFASILSRGLAEAWDASSTLQSCFTSREWDTLMGDLLGAPYKNSPIPCPDISSNVMSAYLNQFTCRLATSEDDWRMAVTEILGDARLTLDAAYACLNPSTSDQPSLTSRDWQPRITLLPLSCETTPRLDLLPS